MVVVSAQSGDTRPTLEHRLLETIAELNRAGKLPDAQQIPRLAGVDPRAGEAALWALHYAGYITGFGVPTKSAPPGAALLRVKLTEKGERAIGGPD